MFAKEQKYVCKTISLASAAKKNLAWMQSIFYNAPLVMLSTVKFKDADATDRARKLSDT